MVEEKRFKLGGLEPHQQDAILKVATNDWEDGKLAVVSMPTRRDRLTILLAAPFVLRARHVLIVTPEESVAPILESVKPKFTLKSYQTLGMLPSGLKPCVGADFRRPDMNFSESLIHDGYDLVIFDEAHQFPIKELGSDIASLYDARTRAKQFASLHDQDFSQKVLLLTSMPFTSMPFSCFKQQDIRRALKGKFVRSSRLLDPIEGIPRENLTSIVENSKDIFSLSTSEKVKMYVAYVRSP